MTQKEQRHSKLSALIASEKASEIEIQEHKVLSEELFQEYSKDIVIQVPDYSNHIKQLNEFSEQLKRKIEKLTKQKENENNSN